MEIFALIVYSMFMFSYADALNINNDMNGRFGSISMYNKMDKDKYESLAIEQIIQSLDWYDPEVRKHISVTLKIRSFH